MATKLSHSATANSESVVAIGFAAEPVGGFNATAALDTATSATVELQVRVGAEWLVAATLTLSSGGDTKLNQPVYPSYTAARWNVTAISGGSINLDAIGLGV
jgi:hypothetical protein